MNQTKGKGKRGKTVQRVKKGKMDKNGLKSFIFEDWIGGLIIFQKLAKGIKIDHRSQC